MTVRRRYGIHLAAGLCRALLIAGAIALLLLGRAESGKAAPTATPTPSVTPTPYGPVYHSGESEHEEIHRDVFGNEILLAGTVGASGLLQFFPGESRPPEVSNQEMATILGWPDCDAENTAGALRLGSYGCVVLDFNAVIRDSAGIFLHIFTTGADSGQMKVSLSADAVKWYQIELKSQRFTGADRYTNLPENLKPRYVKIEDNGKAEGGIAIDAVVIFAPGSLTASEDTTETSMPIYEKFGLSKRLFYGSCIGAGLLVAAVAVMYIIRWRNRYRKKHRLRLVYSKRQAKRQQTESARRREKPQDAGDSKRGSKRGE